MASSRLDTVRTSSAGTNRNSASGSTNRRISHGQATRSTLAFLRVTHFIGFASPCDWRYVASGASPQEDPDEQSHSSCNKDKNGLRVPETPQDQQAPQGDGCSRQVKDRSARQDDYGAGYGASSSGCRALHERPELKVVAVPLEPRRRE